jgi:uncharacterized protein (UPF0548 family)
MTGVCPIVFLLRRPLPALLARLLAEEAGRPLSYPTPGITRSGGAPGYPRNGRDVVLGAGAATYRRAVAAVRAWAMYDLPWTRLHPGPPAVEPGREFAVVVRHLGFWSVNPCRIVYVEEEETPERSSLSLAIGTLPRHSERGEERFRVEWRRIDDSVRFGILAFAEPAHWLARLGAPYVRVLQRRFARDAARAVSERVSG